MKQGRTYPETQGLLEPSLGASVPVDNGEQANHRKHSLIRSRLISQWRPGLPSEERNLDQPKGCLKVRRTKTGCWKTELTNITHVLETSRARGLFRIKSSQSLWLATTTKGFETEETPKENMSIFAWRKGSAVNGHPSHAISYSFTPCLSPAHCPRGPFQDGVDLFCTEPGLGPPCIPLPCPGLLWWVVVGLPWDFLGARHAEPESGGG